MNNIDSILNSIKEKAQNEADSIIEKARNEADEIVKSKEDEANKEEAKIISKAHKDGDFYIKSTVTSSNRKARDLKVAAQNQVIDDILCELKEKLKNLSDDDYKTYVKNTLKNVKLDKAEILLQKDKKHVFSNNDFENLVISDETVDEGFVLRRGKIEYDNRFSQVIDYNSDIYKKMLREKLFK